MLYLLENNIDPTVTSLLAKACLNIFGGWGGLFTNQPTSLPQLNCFCSYLAVFAINKTKLVSPENSGWAKVIFKVGLCLKC